MQGLDLNEDDEKKLVDGIFSSAIDCLSGEFALWCGACKKWRAACWVLASSSSFSHPPSTLTACQVRQLVPRLDFPCAAASRLIGGRICLVLPTLILAL